MSSRRDSASRIWRTVVVAGAMIGAPAIAYGDPKPDTKPDVKPDTKSGAKQKPDTKDGKAKPDPKKDDPPPPPRPRANGDRPTGRGFVLA